LERELRLGRNAKWLYNKTERFEIRVVIVERNEQQMTTHR
jgi:hypothetical protein